MDGSDAGDMREGAKQNCANFKICKQNYTTRPWAACSGRVYDDCCPCCPLLDRRNFPMRFTDGFTGGRANG